MSLSLKINIGRGWHPLLSVWARVDVELAFLAEMAMSDPLRPDIGGMPIIYTSGWSQLVLFSQSHFGSHILVGVGDIQDAKMLHQKRKSAVLGPPFEM